MAMGRPPQVKWYPSKNAFMVTIHGKRHNLGQEESEANRTYHLLMAEAEASSTPDCEITVGYLARIFLESYEHAEIRTHEFYERYVEKFIADKRTLRVAEVKPHMITDWIRRDFPKASPNTKNGAIRAISRMFNWGIKGGRIQITNPCKGVERPTYEPRQTYIEPENWEVIFRHIAKDDTFLDFVVFMKNTGCRPVEARWMTAKNYDRVNGLIFWGNREKGKFKNRRILLNSTAKEIVERLIDQYPTGPLLRNSQKKPWKTYSICNRFSRLQRKTGLDFSAYTIRFTFCTDALRKGLDPVKVADLMGHKDLQMVMKVYKQVKLESPEMRAALEQATS